MPTVPPRNTHRRVAVLCVGVVLGLAKEMVRQRPWAEGWACCLAESFCLRQEPCVRAILLGQGSDSRSSEVLLALRVNSL